MASLVGADRRATVDRLVEHYDAVAAGSGPRAVSIEASIGLGKTRLLQELYARLATSRQGPVAYWPSALNWDEGSTDVRRDILQARKQVEPTPGWVIPGRTDIPWLWWGVPCQLSHAGNPMRALKDASDQLTVHLNPLTDKLARSTRNRDDAIAILKGVFDLTGVVSPGSAFEVGSKFLEVLQGRLKDKRRSEVIALDRRVETHGESRAEAARIAESLTAVARAQTPVILAVDDAHSADPALVSLLRHLISLDGAPILIVTTAWPDLLGRSPGQGGGTFAEWLAGVESLHPDRLERVTLGKLDNAALGEIVLEFARHTPHETVERLAANASGNPLALNLMLDLDVVRRDAAADGSIDTNPDEIARLPSNLRGLYQDLWRQLPNSVRRVLALVAVQGTEFLPDLVEDAATRLGMHAELMPAFAAARDVHRWIRRVNDDRYEFVESQRFEIAADVVPEVYAEAALDTIRRSLIGCVLRLKASDRWADVDIRTRRIALEGHLEADTELGADADRDLAALADSMVQLAALDTAAGNPARAVELAERALELLAAVAADAGAARAAREVLVEGLVAAGRADEAGPAASELLVATVGGSSQDIAAVSDLLAEVAAEAASDGQAAAGATVDEWGRAPWVPWVAHAVPSLTTLQPSEAGALVTEVVAAEGPVYASRVYDLLRVASGAGRLGRQIRSSLESGIRSATRRGVLVASVPETVGDSGRRVLRLPTQPEVVLRQPGDRPADLVPPGEIAELARSVLRREPGLTREELKRRLAPLLGAPDLGQALDRRLESALPATIGAGLPVAPEEDELGRRPWVGWQVTEVPPLVGLKPVELATHVLAIVEAEGPVAFGRVYELLRQASGADRMSGALRSAVDAGIASGERQGRLVAMRGRRGAPETRVLRTPDQPEVVLRTPGDRTLAVIPLTEVAELARRVEERSPRLTHDQLKRQVAQTLGRDRYTAATDDVLEAALAVGPPSTSASR